MFKALFGKKLFNHSKETVLYDFAQHGLLRDENDGMGLIAYTSDYEQEQKKKNKKNKAKPTINPKKLHELESLNENDFAINADPDYITKQVKSVSKKLSLIYANKNLDREQQREYDRWGGAAYAKQELESIKMRLENRARLDEFKEILEKYPHTSSAKINEVVQAHSNLMCRLATDYIPDMPDEAVQAMDEYNEMCVSLTGLKTNFYIIADKKDFGVKDKRRDPILLAQSPFGFFWQILGAWDEEMIYLGDL